MKIDTYTIKHLSCKTKRGPVRKPLTCKYDNKAVTGHNAESERAKTTVKPEPNWSVLDFLF